MMLHEVAVEKNTDAVNQRAQVTIPSAALGSLLWPKRPVFPEGNAAWTYMVESANAGYAVAVGHTTNGRPHPFEVWVLASEQPRCLGALAKTLSADMRSQDRAWLAKKLDVLEGVTGSEVIDQPLGKGRLVASSNTAAIARVVKHRLQMLGVDSPVQGEPKPLIDAMLSVKEVGHEGTLSWTAEIKNPHTGDDFAVFLPEVETSDGRHRPVAVRLSGRFPRDLDGLAALLTMDMQIVDVAWIGMKLRKLVDYDEPMGSFLAKTPGTGETQRFPSIVAYLARLVMHRYAQLGLLTSAGFPVIEMGIMVDVAGDAANVLPVAA